MNKDGWPLSGRLSKIRDGEELIKTKRKTYLPWCHNILINYEIIGSRTYEYSGMGTSRDI